jgi:hypothetical protein
MNIHGQKANGRMGVLDLAELTALIAGRCPPGVVAPHPGHLANWVMNHNGTPAAGGGSVRTYNGHQIFHYTCHGNAQGGAAIFIAQVAPGVGVIVAVGRHTPVGVTTYNLSWRNGGWGSAVIDIA